ncbi:MAG: glycosyltransferase family 4 protein [Flavobacteriales bacterium]|nr:glycosyltransferase family 4 protein [Flavobacteriales bacterium]
MTKVLILTYYWPPSGGAGVQRWLKFVKYLPEFGITPIVYTHSNGEIPSEDLSLIKEIPKGIEVLKTEIWEPYSWYKKITGKKEKVNTGFLTEERTKKSYLNELAIWIRGNVFIPDARKFWINPSVKYLSDYLNQNKVDVIISTGPPHSMHLIARQLKRKLGLKWIADFRDPWTNIDFYDELKLSKRADKKHRTLEKSVLVEADLVISVGPTLTNELIELGAKNSVTITNGFDYDDQISEELELDEKISIAHIGSFTKTRNPIILLDVLKDVFDDNPSIKDIIELKLVGKVDYNISELIDQYGMNSIVRKIDYMPHDQVIKEQVKSHFLLLVVNDTPNAKGILTGKVFEYLASRRPIIALAPLDGDLAHLIYETNSGIVVDQSNKNQLKELILRYVEDKKNPIQIDNPKVEKYSRRNLAKELSAEIKSLAD